MPVYTSDGFSYKDMLHFQLGQPEDNATPADKSSASPADKGNLSSKDEKLNLGLEPIYGPNAKHFGPEAQAKAEAILGRIAGMVTAPAELATLPGRVFKGEDVTLNEVLDAAFTMATAGYTAGQFMMPKGSLGMYGARNIAPIASKIATELEKEGLNIAQIKKVTGLERGPHGGWLQEFSSAGSRISPVLTGMPKGTKTLLSKVLDYPELYKLYPEAKNLGVRITEAPFKDKSNAIMAYIRSDTPGVGYIAINPAYMHGGAKSNRMGVFDVRGILLHEVNHWIQHLEGRLSKNVQSLTPEELNKLQTNVMEDFPAFKQEFEDALDASARGDFTPYDNFIKRLNTFIADKRISHEIEAYNTYSRRDLSAKQIENSAMRNPKYQSYFPGLPGQKTFPATVKNVPIESGFAGNNPKLQGISGSTVPTIINPTRKDLEAFIKNKKIRMLRGVKDANGHSYFWDGDKATHWDIEQGLMLPGVHSEMHINPNNLDAIFSKNNKK